jgi:hypothetical protein
MTAKPGHCRFRVSTICACWLVNSARTLLNSATATCGDSCLDPVEVVASSCDAWGTRNSAFGSLLLAGATAKGILPVRSSNRRSRASESPPIACARAGSPPANADVNSLGTIRAFPGAAASGFFPAVRPTGSIYRCVGDKAKLLRDLTYLHASGSHFLDRPKQFQFLLLALPGNFHLMHHDAGSDPNRLASTLYFLCCRRWR